MPYRKDAALHIADYQLELDARWVRCKGTFWMAWKGCPPAGGIRPPSPLEQHLPDGPRVRILLQKAPCKLLSLREADAP